MAIKTLYDGKPLASPEELDSIEKLRIELARLAATIASGAYQSKEDAADLRMIVKVYGMIQGCLRDKAIEEAEEIARSLQERHGGRS